MDATQLTTLAVVQGLTEFLPISSSAHLILVPRLLGWPDQGLAFDVAVHVGTLFAVVGYFRRDIAILLGDWLASCVRRESVGQSGLAWAVLWGTVPAALAGLLFSDLVETNLRSPLVIAVTTLLFGLLLWGADRWGRRTREVRTLTWRDVVVIGLAQAVALIPGTSRSGITMTAGLALGLTRDASARFSFLLSVPLISLAGGYKMLQLVRAGEMDQSWSVLAIAVLLSAASAWACIHFFMAWIAKSSLMPFVAYRLILGVLLLFLFT